MRNAESIDRPMLFWTSTRRAYDSTFILEARPGSLRLIHPTLKAWYFRSMTLLLILALPPLVLYLVWGPLNQWTVTESRLLLPGFVIELTVFFIISGKPSLRFLANHPEKTEDRVRVLKLRRRGRGASLEVLLEAWGAEKWTSIVAREAQLRAALIAAGQPEPAIEPPTPPPA